MYASEANATSPIRSLGRLSMNFFNTSRAIVSRSAGWPRSSKSSSAMLKDISITTAISTPLALILVSLLVNLGCASAMISRARMSHRSAARKAPERVRLTLRIPRTSWTDE